VFATLIQYDPKRITQVMKSAKAVHIMPALKQTASHKEITEYRGAGKYRCVRSYVSED
jgi:hypothetical protein